MTTDDFTTAACESAASKYRGDWDAFQREPVDDWGYSEAERRAHIAGWKAARDHLAQQEPTDAECIHVLSVLGTDLGQPTRTDFEWSQAAIRRCREALIAARKARR